MVEESSLKDYSVEIRLKNNRLIQHIKKAGFPTVAAFCRAYGLVYTQVNALIGMRDRACKLDGSTRGLVEDIADALDCNPEELFNDRQWWADFETTKLIKEVDDPTISLTECDKLAIAPPQEHVHHTAIVQEILHMLSPREARFLSLRYGLSGQPPMTLHEAGAEIGVSQERARQIEVKALMKAKKRLEGHCQAILH